MQSKEIGDVVLNAKQIEQGVEIVAERLNQVFKQAVVITVTPWRYSIYG